MLEMLQAVEPPVLYAIIGVIVLAVASLFGLVLFASREETFEDVVAKQRKAQEALLNSLQGGSGKGKQNRKWNKLKSKKASKVKEQEENEIDSGVDDDEPCPESVSAVSPPPEIAAEEPTPPPTTSKKKRKGKKNKGQQQQQQQDIIPHATVVVEPPPEVIEEDIPVIEETEEEEIQVEEEVIIVETVDDVEAEPKSLSDGEPDEVSADECDEEIPIMEDAIEEVEEIVQEAEPVVEIAEADVPVTIPEPVQSVQTVVETATANATSSKPRKKKPNKSSQQKGVITNTVDKLAIELENSHLSSEEVQQVMDVLLKKQSELEQWQKPNQKSDPLEILKKRIAEAEMQFAEERQSAQAMAMKNKELRLELQQERNHRQSIQNEATNRLSQQAKEADAMCKRMEEKHMGEMHSLQSQVTRMQVIIDDGANHHIELQRLKEENGHLKNASMMAQQLAEDKQSLMTELSQLQQSNKSLRQDLDNVMLHNQQEMQNLQIAKVDSENAYNQRLQEVNEQLMKVEAQNRNLQQQIEVAEQCKVELESVQNSVPPDELEELNSKLLQIEMKFNDSESFVKVLHDQLEAKTKDLEDTRTLLSEAQAKITEVESALATAEVVAEAAAAAAAAAAVAAAAESEISLAEATEDAEDKDAQPCHEEVAKLVATVEEKDQMILVLEQKVAELESHSDGSSGQHSPDMVVVTSSDLLGSEPIITSESFEEVSAEKDYQDETDTCAEVKIEVATEVALETAPEESLLVESTVPVSQDETIQALQKEIEELKAVETSLNETIAKLEADQARSEEELKEAEKALADKLAIITMGNDTINEKDNVIARKMQAILKAEEALQEAERQLAESYATIVAKDDIITEKEDEIAKRQATIDTHSQTIREKESAIADSVVQIFDLTSALESGTSEDAAELDKTTDLNNLIIEKDELISELKEKMEMLEEEAMKLKEQAPIEITPADAELEEKLKSVMEELTAKTEANEHLTVKNNELRQKNWKVIDALGKAESTTSEKLKAIEISICKGLKRMFPDVGIPKYDNDFDRLFTEYAEKVLESTAQKSCELESDMTKTKEINEKLMNEIEELKKTNELMQASEDEIEKSQEENIHLKNVLTETECMLSRLQTGVDAEVQKWQKKVNEKDTELEESKKSHDELKQLLSKHGYEHGNLATLEINLSDGQKQLMAEKEENIRIKTEFKELEGTLTEAHQLLLKERDEHTHKITELEEKVKACSNDTELAEVNTKLKKTISERDLLIREYKTIKETCDGLKKEVEQFKAQVASQTSSSSSSGQVLKDKDAEIAKLNIEIQDLKEELREERDCVIVDIDPDNAENLHKQVENLSTELQSEKQCKETLASKLHDIEKSYKEECSDSDKILDLESKLQSAEQRIKELETEKSKSSPKLTRQNSPIPKTSSLQW